MNDGSIALLVVARFKNRMADQPSGARQDAKKLVKPINSPKGISRETVREYVKTEDDGNDETIKPNRRDIQPVDVFQPKPRHMNVLDYARKGWPGTDSDYSDMDHALRNQIHNDKGWDTVKNLSQYLVRTEGGGGTKPVGNK